MSTNRSNDIRVGLGIGMNRLRNGTRTVGISLLFLMMMFAPGCLEDSTISSAAGPSGPCDLFETTLGNSSNGSVVGVGSNETSEVTLVVSHSTDGTTLTCYSIVIELDHALAPNHANNFRTHSQLGNYDNVTFHRIIDDFMVQGGDFENGDGTGGYAARWYGICDGQPMNQSDCPDYTYYNVNDEADNGLQHFGCTISMAKTSYPNTGGSQFFLMPDDINHHNWLDGVHTVFGIVTSGCEHITTLSEVATDQYDRPSLAVTLVSATASD